MALNLHHAAAALALVLAAVLPLSGCVPTATASVEYGSGEYTNYCGQCHGPTGAGNPGVGAPAIAGLPDWYVVEQVNKFRTSLRGAHFDDIEGLRMRPMAMTLHSDTEILAVAMFVATMPPVPSPSTLTGGDAEKGKTLYVTCSACHGPDAVGNQTLGAPPLVLQNDWYLARQIGKFKSGVRGANPADVRGGQMRPMAAMLTDDQAVSDVVAYIQTLRK